MARYRCSKRAGQEDKARCLRLVVQGEPPMKRRAMRTTKTKWALIVPVLALLLPVFSLQLLADAEDPPERAARLSYAQGSVSLQPSGESQWDQATVNYTLTTGDRLYADQNSRAEVEVGPS